MSGSVIRGRQRIEELEDDVFEDDEIEDADDSQETEQTADYWRERFTGLQGGYQQRIEQDRAARVRLEQQLFQSEAARFIQSIQHMEPEQQNFLYQNWVREQQLTRAQQEMYGQMSQADAVVKNVGATLLAQKYKVSKDELMAFDTPEAMEAAAKLASRNRRTGRNQAANKPRRDNFGTGGSNVTTQPRNKPKNLRDARNTFRERAHKAFGN